MRMFLSECKLITSICRQRNASSWISVFLTPPNPKPERGIVCPIIAYASGDGLSPKDGKFFGHVAL